MIVGFIHVKNRQYTKESEEILWQEHVLDTETNQMLD